MKRTKAEFVLGEILANAITHGVGLLLALAGAAYLIRASLGTGPWCVVSCSVYAGTLALIYLCSTLYHSLVATRARRVFQVLDHSAIYLLIAGTYTPFLLVAMRGRLAWILFGVEWALAAAGVVFKSLALGRFPVGSALVYLLQGWLAVFVLHPLLLAIGWGGMLWVIAGGLAYTVGIAFFAMDRLRYFHAVWHLFVLAGSIAHYFAILLYVIPLSRFPGR
ncbi:MAG: PAQR family membrane homeostasis protein TrhA [Acidobacteriota bacterium]